MKAVIKGKRYNTDTAEIVGGWDNGLYLSDFGRAEEVLYRRKRGAYFLHGAGGALSAYAESHGNSLGWGERIIPLTRQEAYKWACAKLASGEIERHFADLIEDA